MRFLVIVLFFVLYSLQGIFSVLHKDELSAACIIRNFTQVQGALRACDSILVEKLQVPAGKTLKLDLFNVSRLVFSGNITFGYAQWAGPLVEIKGRDVVIEGEKGSLLDGQGPLYWDGKGEWGSLKPLFFNIELHNATMKDIHVLNSPVHCVLLNNSTDVELSDWTIDNSAGNPSIVGTDKAGHNTDGFDIWNGTNIVLKNSVVSNQDDCVAIRCGDNILVDDLICSGGHGLSISVGFSNDSVAANTLKNVIVQNSILKDGENAIHIKTHVDAGNGLIQNVTYRNIDFQGPVNYGINIQENYRNLPANSSYPSEPKNNIPIRNLILENIVGSVAPSATPIYINCAKDGCFDWTFSNILVFGSKNNSCNYVPTGFSC